MSAARALPQPGIADPAFNRATGRAFVYGYNARVLGQSKREGNPFSRWVAPRQYNAWQDGWDLADTTGLLVKLPE